MQLSRYLLLAAVLAASLTGVTRAAPERDVVYLLRVDGMIEKGLLYVLRRGVAEAENLNAAALVFRMDTPGGAVNTTEEIVELIQQVTVPTYTLVERNAISAGAIIALSTDHIYMTPGSKIGDAMPIVPGQQLAEAEREKAESYVAGMVRAIAEQSGRDPQLAEAMVRKDIEFRIGDEVICPTGQVLTLTNREAEKEYVIDGEPRKLLSAGTVSNLDGLLNHLGLGDAKRVELEVTAAERMARFIAQMAPILMAVGFLALYIEFQTPGIGWGAAIGAVALLLFFFGHHIAGLAGQEEVVLFAIGVALILVELLILPGFGVAGIAGIALVLYSLLTAMVPRLPQDPWFPDLGDLRVPAFKLAVSLVFAGVGAVVAGRYLPRSRAFQSRLVLNTDTGTSTGYTSAPDLHELVGRQGEAITDLRPGGTGMFGDRQEDVVTRGDFIDRGATIRVVETHGSRIIVEPCDKPA